MAQLVGSIAPELHPELLSTASSWNDTSWRDLLRSSVVTTCDVNVAGNGQCDLSNDMSDDNCKFDGGDCCISSCVANCVAKQGLPVAGNDQPLQYPRIAYPTDCMFMCGTPQAASFGCPYFCLDDSYVNVGTNLVGFCAEPKRGVLKPMSQCYFSEVEIARALRQCIMDDRAHGNAITSSYLCGNFSGQCKLPDLTAGNGCNLHPSQCTKSGCCAQAIAAGWIDATVKIIPSLSDIIAKCTKDPSCFPTMTECIVGNKACQGGCCICDSLNWYGTNCDQPLCWSKCIHGTCVAPHTCYCETGWTGPSCEEAICSDPCIYGQGVCVAPDTCDCFYGWSGGKCQTPISYPPCVNGVAIAPDVCKCEIGWGGRICDYPLCQTYPLPSADCGHGYCDRPFQCVCDPGWDFFIEIDQYGKEILPVWWRGRNVSDLIDPTDFVYGDDRFQQFSETQYSYSLYNAFKCGIADCRVIADANCKRCEPFSGTCIECDAGTFLVTQTTSSSDLAVQSKCLQCNLQWPHCSLCTSTRCTACDPLFVLYKGNCVSDGIIEFTSPTYHVNSDAKVVTVTVVRSLDALQVDWALTRPVKLRLSTRDSSAVSVSKTPGLLTDFGAVDLSFTMGHVSALSGPTINPFQAELLGEYIGVSSYRSAARTALQLLYKVDIPIFDNALFDRHVKSFKVKLEVSIESMRGTPSDGVILQEAEVFIWDTYSYFPTLDSSLNSDSLSQLSTSVWSAIPFIVDLATCSSPVCTEVVPVEDQDASRLITVTRSLGNKRYTLGNAVFSLTPLDGKLTGFAVPYTAGPFEVTVGLAKPGLFGSYYQFTSPPSPSQEPSIKRIDSQLNAYWFKSQFAPSYISWTGFLHWGCIDFSAGGSIPTSLGLHVVADSTAVMYWRNAGVVLNVSTPLAATATHPADATIEACSSVDNMYCFSVRSSSTIDDV